ncbi:MAG: glycosyltransferase, partial [Pseudomonadota bacterium]|nr:glycosyltransferase [Pseudomonadota bacterium]
MSINNQLTAMHDEYRTWRVAIVHDWLVVNGGAEKVLSALLQAFPQADLHTLVNFLPAKEAGWLQGHRVVTSVLQRMPLAKRFYRHYLPLMPYAVEQFDLRGYDLVISSSHAVAKGVVTHPGQQHICYCHTPMRYAWDMKEDYLEKARFRLPLMEAYVRKTLKQLRQWDYFTSNHVDYFIANSHNVANRIQKYYRRDAQVLYPPVDTEQFLLNSELRESYYLAASRLVPYKRLDLIIEAFQATPHRRLKVVGDGPEFERLKLMAREHDHIELLGYQPDEQLIHLMSHA